MTNQSLPLSQQLLANVRELLNQSRVEYGKAVLKAFSQLLTTEFVKGFSARNIRNMRRFYLALPIPQAVSAELNWSHYCQFIIEKQIVRFAQSPKGYLRDPYQAISHDAHRQK